MDLISRELAMSHPFANGKYDHENANEDFILGFEAYKEWLSQLPTAEPQIIYCKDCKYYRRNIACVGGEYSGCSLWLNEGNEIEVEENDFCSCAERMEGTDG